MAEQSSYRSQDGTRIPITLIQSTEQKPIACLLSAYGAGGTPNTPRFSVLLSVLAEEGFLCAIAHVRGGGEYGPAWHQAGSKIQKQKGVDDLICAGEWLSRENGFSEKAIGVAGQSSGALLALCAAIQRPGLFRALLALGPVTDLTRFHLFGVGRGFVAELGSPEDATEFAALYRLSPYHQVQEGQSYPAMLFVSGDLDRRCDSLHARKMIARLKNISSQSYPILLDYTASRGHKPVLTLSERIQSLTDRITFLISELAGDAVQGTSR